MILQAVLDFVRDVLVNWITGVGQLASGVGASAAGAAVGGVAAPAGHFIALFVSPTVWPVVVSAFGVWLSVWLTTAVVAIVARRGAAS